MYATDTVIQNYFSLTRESLLTEYLYLVTILFDASIHFILISLCITALIYLFRGVRYSLLFISTLFFGAVLVYLLKILFGVARPGDGVIDVLGNSFPSGHATAATIFFVMLMYCFDKYFNTLGKVFFNTICVFGIIVIAFSRVYLGVHWLSDVFVGILLGGLISFIGILTFNVRNGKKFRL